MRRLLRRYSANDGSLERKAKQDGSKIGFRLARDSDGALKE